MNFGRKIRFGVVRDRDFHDPQRLAEFLLLNIEACQAAQRVELQIVATPYGSECFELAPQLLPIEFVEAAAEQRIVVQRLRLGLVVTALYRLLQDVECFDRPPQTIEHPGIEDLQLRRRRRR